jgi:hypothetical protein
MAHSSTYGDNDFPGKGVLKCRICDKPYAKHERIGPCENLPYGVRLTTGTGKRGTGKRVRKPNGEWAVTQ